MRWYAALRISASSPRRTVSVSVAAFAAIRAWAKSLSSMCSVFFIGTFLPYR